MGRVKPSTASLRAGTAALALAIALPVAAQESAPPTRVDPNIIIVLGIIDRGTFDGAAVEDELGEADIAGYGSDTVGDLLSEIGSDLQQGEDGPVILVNGKLVSGADDIADLPAEAVSRIQLLPSQASAAIGQSPGRRVINVVVKPNHRQLTVTGEGALATAGKGTSSAASATVTRIVKGNRTNLSVRVRDVDALLESDRGLLSRSTAVPFDLVGNVVPFPNGSLQIDPALSALVGRPVTVAGVLRDVSMPTLGQFAQTAGQLNPGDVTAFRSLVAASRNYAFNATIGRRLSARSTLNANLRVDHTTNARLSSAPSVLLQVPASSPFSPFSTTVGVARYLPFGLQNRRQGSSISAGATLNRSLASWSLTLAANWSWRQDESTREHWTGASSLRDDVLAGLINPFAAFPVNNQALLDQDRTETRTTNGSLEATIAGPLTTIASRPISLTTTVGLATDRLNGFSTFAGVRTDDDYRRDEARARASLNFPVFVDSRDNPSPLGALSINLHAGVREATVDGTLFDHGYSFQWAPRPLLTVRGSLEYSERGVPLNRLRAPSERFDDVRYYDYLRGETASVTYLSGGNPALRDERRETLTIGTTITPQQQKRRFINLEYVRDRALDASSELPQATAVIQLAFPDRFIRDGAGALVFVDGRPVGFFRDTQERLSTGIVVSDEFGAVTAQTVRRLGQSADGGDGGIAPPARRAFRYNLALTHLWTLTDVRLLSRLGPVIDFLDGGALGFGGGQARHTIQANVGMSHRMGGLQITSRLRGARIVRAQATPSAADLRFTELATVNLQAFAELGQILPKDSWAKGARISLSVTNLFDEFQVVRDGTGAVPLAYQRYLLDALGRTVGITVRKVF